MRFKYWISPSCMLKLASRQKTTVTLRKYGPFFFRSRGSRSPRLCSPLFHIVVSHRLQFTWTHHRLSKVRRPTNSSRLGSYSITLELRTQYHFLYRLENAPCIFLRIVDE